ncbi:MAG TPA: hypothetical protein VFT16_04360 [Candidatus Saccharimonadales bacterium]|nr:hypothetical protein [Candidatus Saccharimonadales bacterium]
MWNPWKNQPARDDKPSEPEVPDEIITREFAAEGSMLQLLTMDADTVITTGGENISVTVTGCRSELDKLVIDSINGLSIASQRPNASVSISISVNSRSIWQVLLAALFGNHEELLRVTGLGDKHRLKIRATVPDGTDLVLRDYEGSAEADGVYGKVNANVSFDTVLWLNRVMSLSVNAGSGLDLTVQRVVEGDARIKAGYDSKVVIFGGAMETLDLRTGSGARVTVDALSNQVTAVGSYDCEFRLGTIRNLLKVNVGSGSVIYFETDEAEQVQLDMSYDCTVKGMGAVRHVGIKAGSGAEIILGSVTDRLDADCSYDTKLATTQGAGTNTVDVKMGSEADLRLIGSIQQGAIVTTYDASVAVGSLGQVRTSFGSDTDFATGYFTA